MKQLKEIGAWALGIGFIVLVGVLLVAYNQAAYGDWTCVVKQCVQVSK